ncbi:MAG: T9SS type A sorting domain-containing protein [Ignavibacteriaceae bacterium]|jgi:hypothetical protein
MSRLILAFVSSLFITTISFSQYSDPNLYRVGFLNGNNLKLSFYNDGQIAGFSQGVTIRGNWKGNDYIGDMTPLIGVELPIKDYNSDGKVDTIHSVIISRGPRQGQMNEKDPITMAFWGFNPKPGYLNSSLEKIPMSNDRSSWPSFWAEHPDWDSTVWNGLYGKNFFAGGLETYFRIDDNADEEVFKLYGFLPDSTNMNRKGLGLNIGIRYIQPADSNFNDVIYKVYDIKNEGTTTYNKVFYGDIIGTLVGGVGDSGDDLGSIDSITNTVYSFDYDGLGNQGQKVGVMSETLIEAPTNNNIASFSFFNASASPDMSEDEYLWWRFSLGKVDKGPLWPMDGDILWGTNYFSLAPGETKRVVSAIVMGDSISQINAKVLKVKLLWFNNFIYDPDNINDENVITRYALAQNYPNPFNPTTTISYNLPKSGLVNIVIYDVLGKEIKRLASEYKQAGSYKINFDASTLASGVYFYSLRANDFVSTKKMLLLK